MSNRNAQLGNLDQKDISPFSHLAARNSQLTRTAILYADAYFFPESSLSNADLKTSYRRYPVPIPGEFSAGDYLVPDSKQPLVR